MLFKRGCNCENKYFLIRIGPFLIFGKDQQNGAVLNKVYKLKSENKND